MRELFSVTADLVAAAIEIAAALIIVVAAARAAWGAARVFIRPRSETRQGIQREFGGWLVLALEFEIAADILRTAAAPSWSEIGQLAAIVVLRIVLNYFLQRDIDSAPRPAPATRREGLDAVRPTA